MTDLALAKTSLLASLLRPDPQPLARPAVDAFHASLLSAVRRCSYTNIQTCKDWITTHIVPSKTRAELFARYIVALARSFDAPPKKDVNKKEKDISTRRKHLHLLYLLHDVLHHLTFHHPRDSHSPFANAIHPSLATLLHLVASTCEHAQANRKSNIYSHLHDLLTIWEQRIYFPAPTLSYFRKLVTDPQHATATATANDTETPSKQSNQSKQQRTQWRDAPYILPTTHGDPALPYHELPAANLLPHITPNSTAPILPSAVRPLQCAAGPARKELVDAVKNLLAEVDDLYAVNGDADAADKKRKEGKDISELGEIVVRDALGEIVAGETYYGWSRGFCKSMREEIKKRRGQAAGAGVGMRRKRARSWSSEDAGDDHDDRRKQWRRPSRSRSRSPSRSNSRSRSRSYSPPPEVRSVRDTTTRHDTSFSPSRSPQRRHQPSYPPYDEHAPYAPPPPSSTQAAPLPPPPPPPPPPQQQQQQQHPFPPFPMLQTPIAPGFIPPAPPNWNGPWPPPPPPPPPMSFAGAPAGPGIPPPPPPPPGYNVGMQMMMQGFAGPQQPQPQPQQQQQQQQRQQGQGQGQGHGQGQGRGQYGGYYGRR